MEIEITGSNVKEHNLFSCPDCIVVKACKVINNIQHELTNMKCTYCMKEDLHWPLGRQIFHHTLSEGPWLCLGPSELRHTTHHSCSWGQHLLSSKRKKNNYWWLKIKSKQQIIHGHSVLTVLLKKKLLLGLILHKSSISSLKVRLLSLELNEHLASWETMIEAASLE